MRDEMDRLDRIRAALWPAALRGDPRACRIVIRVIGRQARLLGIADA